MGLLFILIIGYFIKVKNLHVYLLVILLTLLILFLTMPKDNLNVYEGRVLSIAKNYYTIKSKEGKVLLYTKDELNYDDYVSFTGHYKIIDSVDSNIGFNFKKYMNENNIKYSIKAVNTKVKKAGNSFKAKLNNKIKKHQSKDYLAMVLLDYTYENLDKSISTLLLSSGLIIREIIRLLKNILNKFMYKNHLLFFEISLLLLYLFLMKNIQFTLFLIIHRLISQTNLERLDKISLSSIFILLLFPNYLFSLSFQITNLFRFAGFIKIRKSNLFMNYLILIPFQLLKFYEVSLTQVFLFPYTKIINIICYLFAYVDIYFNSNISYTLSSKLLINSNKVIFSGHMNVFILFIWISISLKLLQKLKFRYVLSLILIIYINQYQLIFNPSLTYTQVYIGQGDLAIITYPFKADVLLIDTGSNFNESKLESYLKYYGIKEVNRVVISHYDEDHSGNLEYLKENYNIKNITDSTCEFFFHKLKINSFKYELDDNDGSLITYFKVNNITYLSLGDISKEIEDRFIKDFDYIDYNIVKLAHHGSNTSTSENLLSKESLFLTLNSSGINNYYNHPSPTVLKNLNKYHIPILDTQDYGDIRIIHFLNHNFIKVK